MKSGTFLKFVLYTSPTIVSGVVFGILKYYNLTANVYFESVANFFQLSGGFFFVFGYICQIIKILKYPNECDLDVFATWALSYSCYLFEWFAVENFDNMATFFVTNTLCLIFSMIVFLETLTSQNKFFMIWFAVGMFTVPFICKFSLDIWDQLPIVYVATGFILVSNVVSSLNMIRGNYQSYSLKQGSIVCFIVSIFLYYAEISKDPNYMLSIMISVVASLLNNIVYVAAVCWFTRGSRPLRGGRENCSECNKVEEGDLSVKYAMYPAEVVSEETTEELNI